MLSSSLLRSIEIKPSFFRFVPLGLWGEIPSFGHVTSGRSLQQSWHAHTHTHTRVCQTCCCLLCQVKSRHYNTCMHVFVRAVEPVKCGTVILLQQIMSADSARQCEQSEERGCRCWFALLPPLSGEKSRHYTLACTCMCAQWNLSNVGP